MEKNTTPKNNTTRNRKHKVDELKERVKELDCLYGLTNIVKDKTLTTSEALNKIITLIPENGVGTAQHRADPLHELGQDGIAAAVPEAVVHRFEIVDIDNDHRQCVVVLPDPLDLIRKLILKTDTRIRTRDRIPDFSSFFQSRRFLTSYI